MANELNYIGTGSTSGLSLVVDVYSQDGTVLQTGIVATESGTTDIYTADFPAPQASANYMFRYRNTANDNVIAVGEISWDGATQSEGTASSIDPNVEKLVTATFQIVKTMPNTRPGMFNGKLNGQI